MATFEHGGNVKRLAEMSGRSVRDLLDFSANINPLGPPEWVFPLIRSRLSLIKHYPDPEYSLLIERIAERYGVSREQVIAGNGTTEILYLLPRILPAGPVVIPVPSYADYAAAARLHDLPVKTVALREARAFKPDIRAISATLTCK